MRASGRLVLQRLLLCLLLLAPGTPSIVSQNAAAQAAADRAASDAQPDKTRNTLNQPERARLLNALPTPSGADPLYPLNHSFDATGQSLGALVDNADFEAAPATVGTPPTNRDLETAPASVGTQPANNDFATGDFTGWTTAGAVSLDSDATRGSWAKLDASGETITSSAFTVDASAQVFAIEVGYLSTTSTSAVKVYALTGATYSTATLLATLACYQCGSWRTEYLNAAAYSGQSIKLQFSRSFTSVGIDTVQQQAILPGYTISDEAWRETETGGNAYARLESGDLTSAAFTVDSSAQFASLDLKKLGTTDQYQIKVLSGAGFATATQVTAGYAQTAWQTIRFNVTSWRGQPIKLLVHNVSGTFAVDNVGLQRIDVPGWAVEANAYLVDDGAGGHSVSTNGDLTSTAFSVTADTQQVSLRYRGETNSQLYVDLLRGTGFSQVTTIAGALAATDTVNWTTARYSLQPYAGETVKLRIRQGFGRGQYDDVGLGENAEPGWTLTTTGAVATGSDSHGSYVSPDQPTGDVILQSIPLSSGIIDRPGLVDYRYYAIAYEVGFSSTSSIRVNWVDRATGQSWQVFTDAATAPTGYRSRYFRVADQHGVDGTFRIHIGGGGKVYSIADNIARQQLTEPFSRTVGLQIDTSTGSFGYRAQDLATSGALPMVLTRSYVGQSDQYGVLGYRWSHSFETRLQLDATSGDAAVLFGSGSAEFFAWNSTYSTFTAADARTYSTLTKNGSGSFTYQTKSLLTYDFDSAGVLTSIADRNGNTLTFAYDSNGRLQTVTDPANQSLTFAYDTNGRLATVTDPVNAVVSYAYDGNGDLVSVTDPEEGVTSYSYDQHRLTSVTDPNDHTLFTNSYDAWHRVISQTDALNKTITIAYATPGQGATEVTDPEQHTATYYFDRYGRTTDQVDPQAHVISYVFDNNGNLDKIIDPALNQWDFAFDSSGDLTGQEDPLGNPVSITYNAQHLPTTVEDRRGNVTTYAYDTAGNLTSVTDPDNKVTTYTYDSNGFLVSVTNPLNETETYTNDANGNRLTKTNALGKTWTYAYDYAGRLTSETDPLNHTTTYQYDLNGRVTLIRDALNYEKEFLYDPMGHLIRATDELDHETYWSYDDRGLVISKTDPANKVTTYTYDDNRNMTSMTDPLNHTTTYSYDSNNRLISITDALNHTTSYSYDDAGNLASVTDPLNRVTTYEYDDAGNLLTTTLPNTGTETYTYDLDGNRLTVTDPLTHTTTSTYDKLSRLLSVTDPLNQVTSYAYDDAGRLASMTDQANSVTSYGYDDAGQLISVTDPLTHTTTYGYDDAGRRTTITDALNHTTSYAYDALNRLTTVTDPLNQTLGYSYDDAGHLTSVTDPRNKVTSYAYNSRGLLTSITDPLNRVTSYSYDDAGRRTSMTNPRNATTSYGYDAANRLTSITDALNGVVSFAYDAAGQRTSVTNPRGKTTSYTYTDLGLVLTETDPLSQVTTYSYDDAGRLTGTTDPRSISVSYGYDAANQLTTITFPGGSYSFGYDALGRQTELVDPTGTTTWNFDAASRVTSVAAPEGTISYGYDAADRRTSLTLPGSRTVTYGYDAANQLTSLTDWSSRAIDFGYDAAGHRTSIERPNGVESSSSYDDAGQLTDIVHADPNGTLQNSSSSYDAAGNRTAVVSLAGTETYTFDVLNRLTEVDYPNGDVVSFTYDANGNRLTKTVNGVTTSYSYDDADQLTPDGTRSYSYDAAGNLITAGSDSFSWDWANRLTSATVGGTTVDYSYDGTDLRVGATVGGTTTDYLWDRVGELPQVVDDGTNAYLHADGFQASLDGSSAPIYMLADALGSVRGLTDLSGTVTGTADYDVFGAVRSSAGTASLFGFTGEQTDPVTGLVSLRAREYQPALGRLLSRDNVIPNAPGTQGYNPYAYVANNPTTWVDPTGHVVQALWAACAATAWCAEFIALGFYRMSLGVLSAIGGWEIIAFALVVCALDVTYELQYGKSFLGGCFGLAAQFQRLFDAFGSDSPKGAYSGSPSQAADAATSYPANPGSDIYSYQAPWPSDLPRAGEFPYIPPKSAERTGKVEKNRQGGYVDDKGNVWYRDQSGHRGAHWDVQLRGGGYLNVDRNGRIIRQGHPR